MGLNVFRKVAAVPLFAPNYVISPPFFNNFNENDFEPNDLILMLIIVNVNNLLTKNS